MKTFTIACTVLMSVCTLMVLPVFAGPVLDEILAKGELRIGTTGMQPPITATLKDGQIIGVDADIARGLAKSMNLKAVFIKMSFNELLPAIETGKVDIVLSGMTMTIERNQRVAFVGPYYISGKGLLAKAREFSLLRETTGLNSPKVTIAAVKGSTSQDYARSLMPEAKLISPKSLKEAKDLLFNETVDVIVADFPFCVWASSVYTHKELFAGKSPLTYEPLGIALPEDALFINIVQNYLNRIQQSGQLKEILEKWFNELTWFGKSGDALP